jgi:hypothetical protein
MALSYITTLKNARLDEITAAVGTSGKIRIYDGTPPADAGTALSSNTVLADLACSSTFAAGASGGVLTVNAITSDTSADATGTASFFRVLTSANAAVIQGTVGTSGADLNLNTTSISSGATVAISSFTITEGN